MSERIRMRVSIVTVCFNSEKYIEKTIQSVLEQTYKDIEYIIIDGNSTDKTLEIVNNYRNRISKVISEKDNGIYDAMNKGIKEATGDIIYFLNSDDKFVDSQVIDDVVNEFLRMPEVGIIYGKIVVTDLPVGFRNSVLLQDQIIGKKADFLKQSFAQQRIFVRQSVFAKVGVFNLSYKIHADFDWLLSAFEGSIKIHFFNRDIAIMHSRGASYSQFKTGKKEKFRILQRHFSIFIYSMYIIKYYFLTAPRFKIRRLLHKLLLKR